jgi:cell filamentation protein
MIEPLDLAMPGAVAPRNKLGITDPSALATATADFTAFRLAELQVSPIRGGFDSAHLREIHHHLFQDLYEWAGELRGIDSADVPASRLEKSLDSLFDRLAREHHLKGYSSDEWARSASAYVYALGVLQPFLAGNEITVREFTAELARKNDLVLQWNATADIGDAIAQPWQTDQAANMRRVIMLAMDTSPAQQLPSRGDAVERGMERLLSFGNSHL